jgi:membrane protein DedA with SNARE-associated domain
MSLEQLVAEYGYLAILIGTFLEGETILVLGGLAAHDGLLQLKLVILSAFVGSLIGDQLAFFVGRRWGAPWLARHPNWEGRVARARELVERHQILIILVFRFLYGLRNVIPFVLGMSRVKVSRFIPLNIVGAAVWAVALATGGWALGEALESVLDDVKRYQLWVFGGLAAIGCLLWLRRWRRMRREAREQEAARRAQLGE